MSKIKTACISFAIGCPRSMLDAARLVDYFKKNEWRISTDFGEADMVLIGTCGFTALNEDKSVKFISIAQKKMRKSAQLIVFGCLPGINGSRLTSEFKLTALTRNTLNRLDNIIDSDIKIEQIRVPNDLRQYEECISKSYHSVEKLIVRKQIELSKQFFLNTFSYVKPRAIIQTIRDLFKTTDPDTEYFINYNGHRIFNIRIATGCNAECSYCSIKFAVGSLKSESLSTILRQFENGLSKGYTVFRLVAEDVGAYGQDIGTSIVALLEKIFENEKDFLLMIDDFSPKWFIQYFPELSGILTKHSSKIAHIGIPIQSGSDKILSLMKRDYTSEAIKKSLTSLKKAAINLRIRSHVIIGFPGEEEVDFQKTMNFLKEIQFDKVITFIYSDRPKILSSKLPGKIPEKTKKDRQKRMKQILKMVT